MINVIMDISSFPSKKDENKMLHTALLGDGSTVFLSEDKKDQFKTGQTVVVTKKKYKNSEGKWNTSSTITAVSIE